MGDATDLLDWRPVPRVVGHHRGGVVRGGDVPRLSPDGLATALGAALATKPANVRSDVAISSLVTGTVRAAVRAGMA